MSKKMILLLSIIFAGLIIWGFRVYTVNAGVAKTYEIQSFKIGDSIKLDHAELKVIDFQYGEENNKNGDQSLPVKVAMEVMNTSNKDISVQRLIETKLAVFCNRKVQRNAIKNAEVCHPFNSFSTMRGTVYSSRHEKR
ncbi:hypothetical protein P5F77_06110 [Caldifermentibacillus hisashii]|uniref:hypothetical protein n=1 Tax=Caldifermentibacillus hisashii TaxID=996558 RepID=UPI0030D69C6A